MILFNINKLLDIKCNKLFIGICLLIFSNSVFAQLGGYSYKKKITIDNTRVSGTADLTDFPVLISFIDTDLRTTGNGGDVTSDNGYDIAFTWDDGYTLLDYQIEEYVATTGKYVAWVRIPILEFDTDRDIYMYYGNSSVTTDPSSTGVWDANYSGIWHLNESTGATNIDATSNGNDGTPNDVDPVADTGQIGGALDFNAGAGNISRIEIPYDASLDVTLSANWTMSAWVRPTLYDETVGSWPTAYGYGLRATMGLTVKEAGDPPFEGSIEHWRNDNIDVHSNTVTTFNAWNHIAIVRDATNTTFYLNGAADGSVASVAITQSPKIIGIGNSVESLNTDQMHGLLDEVRYSDTNRSADWIATEFNNQNDPSSFYSVDTTETVNDLPCSAILLPVDTACSYNIFSNQYATDSGIPLTECDGYSGGDVWFKIEVPPAGNVAVKIESDAIYQFPDNDGWAYRPGLAVYTGSCDILTHDTCWIDPIGAPPLSPEMVLAGYSPGDTLFLRVWEHSNNDKGKFRICASIPQLEIYNVSGSGSYCAGGSGLSIRLDSSEVGVDYQLKKYGIDQGVPLPGTGNTLTWPGQTEGVYEVVATIGSPGSSENMNGRAIVIEDPLPVVTFGYRFVKTITIDSGIVAGSEDLIDFPMLVSIPADNNLRTTGNGGNVLNNNGYDIVFTDENYNPIPFERISYDPASGAYSAWVNVPLIYYDTDSRIHMLYGKSGISTDHSTIETWPSGYVQVMHLDGDFTDASLTGNYGLNDGTSDTGGKLGSARSFDGVDNKITVFDDPTLDSTNDEATFSLWINWVNSADGDYQIVMSSSNRFSSPGSGYEWASQGSGNHYFYPWGDEADQNYNLGPDPFTDNTWQHLAVTFKYSTKEVKIFVNGIPMSFTVINVPTFWTSLASIDTWLWGGNPTISTRYFTGSMDEIRVQTVARSGDWLRTEYINQNDPSGFYSVSAQVPFEPLVDVCLDVAPFILNQPKPAGGSYSGTGISGGSFDPRVAGAGDHIITYNYTDGNGCVSSGSEIQTVQGLPTPTITGNSNLCPNASAETYSTPDVVGDSYFWEITGAGALISGGQGTNEITVDWGPASGTVKVSETIIATGCDSTTADFIVTIADLTNPVISCPGGLMAVCDISEQPQYENHEAFLAAGGTTSDNCAIDPSSFTFVSDVSDGLTCPETITRSYQISDVYGNSQTCTQDIMIYDSIDPAFDTTQGNLTAVCDITEQPAYPDYAGFVAAGGSASDNCGIDAASFTLESEVSDGLIGPETVTRTYRIADLCGNTDTYSQEIVITENEAPVITCSSDIEQSVDLGSCNAYVVVPVPITSDNCGINSVNNNFNGLADASGLYPVGTTTVTWTATDLSGNTDICMQNITIIDDEEPEINCPGDRTEYLDDKCEFIVPDYITSATFNDNCDPDPVVTQSPVAGTILSGSGTTQEIVLLARDAIGNESGCSFNILLQDNILPDVTSLRDTTVIVEEGIYKTLVNMPLPLFNDNCGVQSIINDFNGVQDASGEYPFGTTTVVYLVTDLNDNSTEFNQQVTVSSENEPEWGLIIPEGFSPNEDGLNDRFEILGIEQYPDNELRVFNVHGNEVYRKKNYDNSWDGTSASNLNKGSKLPTGTYYYAINLGMEEAVIKGFVYLRRD